MHSQEKYGYILMVSLLHPKQMLNHSHLPSKVFTKLWRKLFNQHQMLNLKNQVYVTEKKKNSIISEEMFFEEQDQIFVQRIISKATSSIFVSQYLPKKESARVLNPCLLKVQITRCYSSAVFNVPCNYRETRELRFLSCLSH